ncbi:hypothetical protein [Ramlibacter cellulosilyticus]|nr:hypothetical protein [Ramlibacter cellulosilyticus]
MQKLAWAAVLASSGVPSTEVARPEVAAPAPARPKAEPGPPAEEPGSAWPLELDEDEFEGEGWTFWPLAAPR